MNTVQRTIKLIEEWWAGLPRVKQHGGLPPKGTVTGALVVIDRLKNDYVLKLDHHRAKGQSQIKGAGGAMTKRLLAEFGENRPFSSEGGRTNRGLAGAIQTLLEQLKKAKLDTLPVTSRNEVLTSVQKWLASKVGEYFNQARVRFVYNPGNTAWQAVHDLLEGAREVGKESQVAQYLVGAKLVVRFPKLEIRNDSVSTSDAQSGSPGDFLVNDTAFHVTVSPTPNHFERCKDNLRNGYRPYLIVPDRVLQGTRQNSEIALPGQITTQSLESFVSQNIEELSTFSRDELTKGFRLILETFNKRVDAAETDKSLLIKIPRNI